MKIYLLCALILSSGWRAYAFMNIESIRLASKEGASGSVGLKLNGQSGNSDKVTGEFNTLNMHRSDSNEILFAAKYRYGESQHRKDTHDGNLHARYTRYLGAWQAIETFTQTEFDEFRLLKRRDLLGLGLRSQIDKGEGRALYLGTGAFYEHEDFEENVQDEQTVRANIYLSFVRALTSSVSATVIAYYQPSLEGFNDTRVQLDSGLQVMLVKKLALTVEYDLQHDNQPAPGVEKTDTTYMVGLAYAY